MSVACAAARVTQSGGGGPANVIFGALMLETTLAEIPDLVGRSLGPTDWRIHDEPLQLYPYVQRSAFLCPSNRSRYPKGTVTGPGVGR